MIGEQEMQQEQILLKNLETGDQELVSLSELINKLK
jgi:histidyl-tRNA synthetase